MADYNYDLNAAFYQKSTTGCDGTSPMILHFSNPLHPDVWWSDVPDNTVYQMPDGTLRRLNPGIHPIPFVWSDFDREWLPTVGILAD